MCYINHKTDLVFWGQNAFTSVSYTHVLGWPKSSLGFCKMLGKHPNELFGQPNIILNHMHIKNSIIFFTELLRLEMKEYSIKIFSIPRKYFVT